MNIMDYILEWITDGDDDSIRWWYNMPPTSLDERWTIEVSCVIEQLNENERRMLCRMCGETDDRKIVERVVRYCRDAYEVNMYEEYDL